MTGAGGQFMRWKQPAYKPIKSPGLRNSDNPLRSPSLWEICAMTLLSLNTPCFTSRTSVWSTSSFLEGSDQEPWARAEEKVPVTLTCMRWWWLIHVSTTVQTHRMYNSNRGSTNVNYGFGVTMIWPYMFVCCNKWITLLGDVDGGVIVCLGGAGSIWEFSIFSPSVLLWR